MNGIAQHFLLALQLHLRNRMALLYGYLFPLVFLGAFWVLYRHERVPLLRNFGQLLTVGALGGACFGLPTTLVAERMQGVWRRYRLTPAPTWALVASTAAARYILLLSAGLLQLAVALAVGMTLPAHPLDLWIAFTFVCFAFIGLGLLLAALADNVPAVQALGQCVFLPMLIVGGVAVPVSVLPDWVQRVSSFFPGRYAVEALQAGVTGAGLADMRFGLPALALIGTAACAAGAKLFRWDPSDRVLAWSRYGWVAPALAAWAAVGLIAEWERRIEQAPAVVAVSPEADAPAWATITSLDVVRLDYRVPPDSGVVAPIDPPEEAEDYIERQVSSVRTGLPSWPPGVSGDDIQRVRNLLCVAAVPDVLQIPVERYLAIVVLQHLLHLYPRVTLIKILTSIALHPDEGTVVTSIADLGVRGVANDTDLVRERTYYYAIKFVARLTGRRVGDG